MISNGYSSVTACRDSISKTSFGIFEIFSGTSLVIRDLTEWPDDNWARYYYSGRFSSKGEEFFKLIKVLLVRESSWTVAQALEAFEKFLKDISANVLIEQQQLAETRKVEKFEADKKSNDLEKTDVIFWRTYSDYHYRTNTKKLKFLRKICPDISTAETKNNRVINLNDWFAVVEEVRHSATHSNFLIKIDRLENWSKEKTELLNKNFYGSLTDQGYQLDISKKNATFCLELFSEYSFQIYKSLSILNDYDWDILDKKNGK